MDFYQEIEEIGRDSTSGAAELVQKAVAVLSRYSGEVEPAQMAQALLEARRDMAPIINLALELMRHGNTSSPKEIAEAFLHEQKRSFARCIREIAHLVSEKTTVMTFSRSSTVLAGLLQAKHLGGNFKVLLTESRPGLEGVALARQLAQARIPVVLGVDASMASFVAKANMVLVGADAVGPRVFFNKTGTLALSMIAKLKNVPFYVCATRDKMLNAQGMELYQVRNMSASEIISPLPQGVEVINEYFEPVPTNTVTKFLGI